MLKKVNGNLKYKTIKLSKDFYNKETIFNTLNLYDEFINYDIKENTNYYEINFELIDNDYTIDIIVDEFLNFLLANMYQNK